MVGRFLRKLDVELSLDPATAFLGVHPKELKTGTQPGMHKPKSDSDPTVCQQMNG
jgi:hypothetical protein